MMVVVVVVMVVVVVVVVELRTLHAVAMELHMVEVVVRMHGVDVDDCLHVPLVEWHHVMDMLLMWLLLQLLLMWMHLLPSAHGGC